MDSALLMPLTPEERAHSAEPGQVDPWSALMPIPEDAPRSLPSHPLGKPSAVWAYRDADGRLLCLACRFEKPGGGKEVLPLTFCQGPGGRTEWRWKAPPAPRPPYGLNRLTARLEAPVLVVEGEKKAEPAEWLFPNHVAITSLSGADAAHKTDWSPLAGRDVVIWPDNDEPGRRYAEDVTELARRAGAASLRIVQVPDGFPDGWDLADELPEGVNEAELECLLAEAKPASFDGPLPLFPPMPKPEPFPIEALGPVLSPAAAAIARKVQVPEAIAAQSVLAAASLAAQAHADVLLPYGQTRPISLNFVTVARSGDRKSTADNEALWPVRKHEEKLRQQHDAEHRAWSIAHAAWSAEKRKIEVDRNRTFEQRRVDLVELGPEPTRPLHPFLTSPDPTVEGLAKAWAHAPAALGIFTAEGGQFIGGHGMSQDHRLKTAAACSEIWDGRPIKRIRAMDGVSILHGRRLSMHLMVQPDAAAQFLSDPLLRDQGLLSRVLVAAPETIAGERLYRDVAPEDNAAIKAYGARLLSILEAPLPLQYGKANELAPRTLRLSAEAESAWRKFHDHVEIQCGTGGELRLIQDFAAKAAEHVARIAGVLTILEDIRASEIGLEAMRCAIALVDWYIAEALRLQGAARTDPRLMRAHQLLQWMQQQSDPLIPFRDILRLGPSATRTKSAAEEALRILAEHGWVAEEKGRSHRVRLLSRGTEG